MFTSLLPKKPLFCTVENTTKQILMKILHKAYISYRSGMYLNMNLCSVVLWCPSAHSSVYLSVVCLQLKSVLNLVSYRTSSINYGGLGLVEKVVKLMEKFYV